MTSTTVTPGRALPGWLKTGLLAALVFLLCWGAAIAWWRAGGGEPGAGELVLVLLALPCALLLALGLGKRFVMARPAAAASADSAGAAASQAAAASSAPPVAILAAALRSPHGASPEELADAIADNKARPDLDPELVDDDGFPVTSARSPAAVDETVQEEISDWLAGQDVAAPRFSEGQWRALVLGTAVARELAAQAVSALVDPDKPSPKLRLVPILPASWTAEQRSAARNWIQHAVSEYGWPSAAIDTPDLPPASGQTDISTLLGQLAPDGHAGDTARAVLIIACDSHIDQELVDQWASTGTLMTPTRPQGLVPGEGAAGLLLASLDSARLVEDAVFDQLHPVLEARREASLDTRQRVDSGLMAGLAERAARAAGVALSSVTAIAADTDQRPNRTLELMGFTSSALPQLDATFDVAPVGVTFGACGAVPALAALALARHQALAAGAPVLFISNQDPLSCCAALVCPSAEAAAPAS